MHLLHCPLIVPTCHHVNMTLTPPTMLMTIAAPLSTAALIATLAVVCTAVTVTMMISAVTNPLVLAWTAIMLSMIMLGHHRI